MPVRRGSIVQLVAIGVACGAGAALVALLIPWLPHAASEQAGRIDFVFWFVTAICIAIFSLVAAVILYSVVKFRAQPDEDADPVDVPTKLRITSLDVNHSFWVPEFGQKLDAVPGSWNNLPVTPNREGTFPVICTELCGLGHALMRSRAEVMPRNEFVAWAKAQKKKLGGPAATSGKAVFSNNGCASCHTFKAAGATGKVGPDLDKLPQEAQRAGKPLEQFIRESIVNPNAYVEPGFPKNLMPGTFASLPKPQLDALVTFLAGGKK